VKFIILEYNTKRVNSYFNEFKKYCIDNEINPSELTDYEYISDKEFNDWNNDDWGIIEKQFQAIMGGFESDYERWKYDQGESLINAIYALEADWDNYIEYKIEEDGYAVLVDIEYGEIKDDDYYREFLDSKLENYGWYDYFGGHGYIFEDGTTLDIGYDDHRVIDIDRWFEDNIVTLHISDGDLTVRLNTTTKKTQIQGIREIVEERDIEYIHYDVYDKDHLVNSGTINVKEDWDWSLFDVIRNRK